MTSSTVTLDEIDLSDPDLYASGDPHAVWTHLREHAPVFFQRHDYGPGFWAITRYDDVVRLSSDRRLSSAGGRSTTATAPEPGTPDILVVTDPPRHTQLRNIVNKAFTPRVVAGLEPFIREVVVRLLEPLLERGSCDVATEFAARLPFTVICELLGVPEEDRPAMAHAVGHFLETGAHIEGHAPREQIDVARYFLDLAQKRRRQPASDLVSRLVASEIDGEGLSDADVLMLCSLLFIAGSETTMNAISGGILAFVQHPGQREGFLDDTTLRSRTVEEVLRWVSPVLNGMVRTAIEDIDVRGTTIEAGQKVTLWYPSANRDEDVFESPFSFDIAREPNPHVTFGAGPHFCLGASLARLEIRVAIEEFLTRTTGVELAGEVRRLRSNVSHAIEHLPARYGGAT